MPLNVLVVDRQPLYRGGLASCLAAMEEVDAVTEASSPEEALRSGTLETADVVIVDGALPGGPELVRAARETTDACVFVCSSSCDERDVAAAFEAGADGHLCKDTLTPDELVARVRAARRGREAVSTGLLADVMELTRERPARPVSDLTEREREVLRLVADGHPTREVARRLCYSERTIKNVIHDVVTKLNARTRSQAVAEAVRAGLI